MSDEIALKDEYAKQLHLLPKRKIASGPDGSESPAKSPKQSDGNDSVVHGIHYDSIIGEAMSGVISASQPRVFLDSEQATVIGAANVYNKRNTADESTEPTASTSHNFRNDNENEKSDDDNDRDQMAIATTPTDGITARDDNNRVEDRILAKKPSVLELEFDNKYGKETEMYVVMNIRQDRFVTSLVGKSRADVFRSVVDASDASKTNVIFDRAHYDDWKTLSAYQMSDKILNLVTPFWRIPEYRSMLEDFIRDSDNDADDEADDSDNELIKMAEKQKSQIDLTCNESMPDSTQLTKTQTIPATNDEMSIFDFEDMLCNDRSVPMEIHMVLGNETFTVVSHYNSRRRILHYVTEQAWASVHCSEMKDDREDGEIDSP